MGIMDLMKPKEIKKDKILTTGDELPPGFPEVPVPPPQFRARPEPRPEKQELDITKILQYYDEKLDMLQSAMTANFELVRRDLVQIFDLGLSIKKYTLKSWESSLERKEKNMKGREND